MGPEGGQGDSPNFVGSSADALIVYFASERRYVADAPIGGLYRRAGQTTTLVKDENGNRAPLPTSVETFVSADGSVVAFGTLSGAYVYRHAIGHAVLVAPWSFGFKEVGLSLDGSRNFFVTSDALTPDDEDAAADIYEYEVATGALRRISGTSAGPGPGNGAADAVPVISSPSGSSVYFTSTEQLDGTKGVAGAPNLYVAEGGAIHYAMTLGSGSVGRPRLTRDGDMLLFESSDRLTAYDNAGKTEIYGYDQDDGDVICASCRPTGEIPSGDASFGIPTAASGADRDGDHIFFRTTDPIVPQDVNSDKADVYVYDATYDTTSLISGAGSTGPSKLIGIGAEGRDVFFTSSTSLRLPDRNVGVAKVWDARIGGGFAEPSPSTVCEGEGCRGSASAGPPAVNATTSGFSGPGDPEPVRKKRRHKRHRHHKHEKHRHAKHNTKHHKTGRHLPDAKNKGRTDR
jgi:hypothetical protein